MAASSFHQGNRSNLSRNGCALPDVGPIGHAPENEKEKERKRKKGKGEKQKRNGGRKIK